METVENLHSCVDSVKDLQRGRGAENHPALPLSGGVGWRPVSATGDNGLVISSINGKKSRVRPDDLSTSEKERFYREKKFLIEKGSPERMATVAVYPRDVKVTRRIGNRKTKSPHNSTRSTITELSYKSRGRLVFTARNIEGFRTMATLTYPAEFPCDGKLVKKHLEKIRKWFLYRDLGGFWFLEFQERGAPHYHVFLTGEIDKRQLAQAWFKIVGSGDEKHLRAGTRIEAVRNPHAVAAYAAKYASKAEQKEVPVDYLNVGRFWGTFGGLKPQPTEETTGPITVVKDDIRQIKKIYNHHRKEKGFPPLRDNGISGFTAYDVGPIAEKYYRRFCPF